jgi:RNA polymerase sigma-70 factor (ECF subfamily)
MTALAQVSHNLDADGFAAGVRRPLPAPLTGLRASRDVTAYHDLDPDTLQGCIEGRRSSWRLLHRRYYPIAMAFLRKMGVSAEELEDACQEVFLRCHRALPSFRGESQFKTWFYRLCLTEATRSYRRRRLALAARSVMLAQLPSPAVTQLEMSPNTAAQHVKEALAEMNHGDRSVFVLYELEGLSGKQVASILRCPVATVWRRLHYSRRIFRHTVSLASMV